MILYRHPTPDAPKGMCYGRMDIGLSPHAEEEIARAVLSAPKAARIVSSPARRARALAQALANSIEASLILDDRLWELDFGTWEGQMWDQIQRAESDPWAADPWSIAPPKGETFEALHSRVAAALEEAGDAIIVAHAGPIRAARMIVEGASFDQVFAEAVPYASPIYLRGR